MELKGTKTEKNLWTAFAGESQARNKYTFYASKARKDGYVQIAKIFEETAANEKEHAELWFKAAARRRHSRHGRQPAGRRRGRELRVDRYVCPAWRRTPRKRALTTWLSCLKKWERSSSEHEEPLPQAAGQR